MKYCVFSYSAKGCGLAEKVKTVLGGDPNGDDRKVDIILYTVERLAKEGFLAILSPSSPLYAEAFASADALIFIGAAGIALRCCAPHIKSKETDPAVLCLDETGRFVIPLLSGHIGGANRLAARLAESLGAEAVITTATDAVGRFSADAWASEKGFDISSIKTAKEISAAILERDLPLYCEVGVKGPLPPGTFASREGDLGIYIGVRDSGPFDRSLRLVPKALHLGLGSRKGVSKEGVKKAVETALKEAGLDPKALKCAASIDIKADEAGIREYCEETGLPLSFYSAGELSALEGDFSSSDFVKKVAGVDCVCERSALMGAKRLIVKKTVLDGVTVAVAEEEWEASFE